MLKRRIQGPDRESDFAEQRVDDYNDPLALLLKVYLNSFMTRKAKICGSQSPALYKLCCDCCSPRKHVSAQLQNGRVHAPCLAAFFSPHLKDREDDRGNLHGFKVKSAGSHVLSLLLFEGNTSCHLNCAETTMYLSLLQTHSTLQKQPPWSIVV